MSTAFGLDIETIEHLDFEFAPPCEQDTDCDNEAEWKIVPACCGRNILFCTTCKDDLVEGLERSPYVTDKVCGKQKTTILYIEPLDKG